MDSRTPAVKAGSQSNVSRMATTIRRVDRLFPTYCNASPFFDGRCRYPIAEQREPHGDYDSPCESATSHR
jgi:hypothetical protein